MAAPHPAGVRAGACPPGTSTAARRRQRQPNRLSPRPLHSAANAPERGQISYTPACGKPRLGVTMPRPSERKNRPNCGWRRRALRLGPLPKPPPQRRPHVMHHPGPLRVTRRRAVVHPEGMCMVRAPTHQVPCFRASPPPRFLHPEHSCRRAPTTLGARQAASIRTHKSPSPPCRYCSATHLCGRSGASTPQRHSRNP